LKLSEPIGILRDKIELREQQRLVKLGREHLDKGNWDAALEQFKAAQDVRDTPEVRDLIQKAAVEKQYAAAIARGDKAVLDGKWADAVAAFEDAQKLKPSEALKTKLNNAKAADLVAQANTLWDSGAKAVAGALYQQAVLLNPNDPTAPPRIRELNNEQQLQNYVKNGKDAMAASKFDEAASAFEQALPLVKADQAALKTEVEGLLTEAKYQKLMADARDALGRDEFEKARAAAADAQKVKDGDEVKALLALIDQRELYTQHLAVGKELLSQGDYVKARESFQKAQKVDDSQEVRDLIRQTYFRQYLTQSRSMAKDKKLEEARSLARIAQKYAETANEKAEVEGWISLLEGAINKTEAAAKK